MNGLMIDDDELSKSVGVENGLTIVENDSL